MITAQVAPNPPRARQWGIRAEGEVLVGVETAQEWATNRETGAQSGTKRARGQLARPGRGRGRQAGRHAGKQANGTQAGSVSRALIRHCLQSCVLLRIGCKSTHLLPARPRAPSVQVVRESCLPSRLGLGSSVFPPTPTRRRSISVNPSRRNSFFGGIFSLLVVPVPLSCLIFQELGLGDQPLRPVNIGCHEQSTCRRPL